RFDCDWSSDVCSSDLQPRDMASRYWAYQSGVAVAAVGRRGSCGAGSATRHRVLPARREPRPPMAWPATPESYMLPEVARDGSERSEERRVGKERRSRR